MQLHVHLKQSAKLAISGIDNMLWTSHTAEPGREGRGERSSKRDKKSIMSAVYVMTYNSPILSLSFTSRSPLSPRPARFA